MARALNATGRPIVYSCSWPAYQGGLPPKVRICLSVGKFPCPLCPGGALAGVLETGCYTPLTCLPLDGAPQREWDLPARHLGTLGGPNMASLWEEGYGLYAPHPTQMVWGWS